MNPATKLINSITKMPGQFADVATQGPAEGVLVLFGAMFVVLPSIALGYLTLGAGLDLVTPGQIGSKHPEE
ncbi:hypothetical protein ACFQJ7_15665 [Halovenus rubra]|uniref:Uncharacterized protein n=2 Tax=Halovenus rubra TaxID=869890 RepID=A0ABD5X849_9EURY|nr:hypothetical protein [Halovenus rubra]